MIESLFYIGIGCFTVSLLGLTYGITKQKIPGTSFIQAVNTIYYPARPTE